VQADDGKNSDKKKQLDNQHDAIKNVVDWLREEGLEPNEITHLRKDACYYGVVISDQAEKTEQEKTRDERLFTFFFQLISLIV
jgi:hypothetical protein